MTEYYTNVSVKYGKIYYRGYEILGDTRKRVHAKLPYSPTLYLVDKGNESSLFKSIYEKKLKPKKFETIPLARAFIKEFKDAMEIYGSDSNRFEYDFIAKSFPEVLSVGIADITVGMIDIETTTEHGKIDTVNTPEEIILITYLNVKTKKLVTFGARPTTTDNYILCKDEADVLVKFIQHVQMDDPDILSGWNSNSFDINYIINRTNQILGEEVTNKLSPFGIIEMREKNIKGKNIQVFDIVGRSCLDMLELYKKFTLIKRESYKLENICRIELGSGKLVNPYTTFKEFYTLAWDDFVSYNQIDTVRVDELEDKLGLISLALAVAYLTKCNYEDVFSPVKYWECYILATLSYENTFCSIKRNNSNTESLDGAYVFDPVIGFHDWIVSIDGTALYPSIIDGLNMSPETIIDKDNTCSIESFLAGRHNFGDRDFTVAANGVRFSKSKKGVMPRLVNNVLDGRRIAKNAMLKAKQDYEDTHDIQYKKIAELQNTFQGAYKVMANSLFGICGNEGFIFFDHRLAEGITHTGQFVLKYIAAHMNMRLNEFFKTVGVKYMIYGDTDSLYFTFGNIVEKYYKGKTDLQIVAALDKLMEEHIRKFIVEATDSIATMQNYYKKTIVFKREAISSGGFWLAKKKYALKVYDNEGVLYKDGDYKFMGLEVVRSSTPEIARELLKKCVIHIIDKDIDALRKVVEETHQEFRTVDVERIAFPRGVNNLKKYSDETMIYGGGTPIAVRAALLHNYHVDKLGISDTTQPIEEGEKIRFLYLKEPNHFKEDVIGFVDRLPNEFKLDKYVDREKQYEKVFLNPIDGIMKAIGWELEEKEENLFD
jgi:DNA polymerase elongation subunit (family B)